MDFSQEASELELSWLQSGQLEDVDDKFVKEHKDKYNENNVVPVAPQYSGSTYNDTFYQYGRTHFDFDASFYLDDLQKIDQLLNLLQQNDIVITSYNLNCEYNFYVVNITFCVPGYKMTGTSYNELFAEIKKHIGIYGQILSINCRMHQDVTKLYSL